MNKYLKTLFIIICSIILLVLVDLACIFTINRPIIAIKKNNVYYGVFYDSYDCMEYSVLQIKPKNSKFSCAVSKEVWYFFLCKLKGEKIWKIKF